MSERLSDITARIDGIGKLGSVVNAMRGIAAAHSRQAHSQLDAVNSYADTIRHAMARLLPLLEGDAPDPVRKAPRRSLVVFLAEQGFAGAFSERVLDAISKEWEDCELFLVGSRGGGLALERGANPRAQVAMPAHSSAIPRLADKLATQIYQVLAEHDSNVLDVVFSVAEAGAAISIQRRRLLPFDMESVRHEATLTTPLIDLPPRQLLARMTGEYIHAQLCHAALHAFAAENEARMQAMASTHSQIERTLSELEGRRRIVRQEEITGEIIELAAGEAASRKHDRRKPNPA